VIDNARVKRSSLGSITDPRALLGVRDVRFTPDNKRAAFAGGTGIWTLDLERETKTRVTFDQQVVQEPAWSENSKSILFSARWAEVTVQSNSARKRRIKVELHRSRMYFAVATEDFDSMLTNTPEQY
jgi:hypothetical protein